MSNPNPKTDHLKSTQWKKGESPNPGGKTSEQRQLEIANAEKATAVQGLILDALIKDIGAEANLDHIKGDILKLIKDSQDRGLGSPKNSTKYSGGLVIANATVKFID